MAADRVITCTNQDGDSLTFTEKDFTPFLLVKADGIYDSTNSLNITENTMTDGAVFQGSTAKYRNIVLTLKDINTSKSDAPDYDTYVEAVIKGKTLEILSSVDAGTSPIGKDFVENRTLLDKVFKRNELGRLTFEEGEEERVIDYYVEYVRSSGTHTSRVHTISLICPDPFFYEPYDAKISLAQMVSDFEFIHEFVSSGEEFGHSMGYYENIYNESANESIGLTITVRGDTDIVNPVITRMESLKFIQVGDTNTPYTLNAGDTLTITTGIGNKHVYEEHNGIKTEINYRLADGSTFLQLMRGNNHFSYNAESGKNAMNVDITYRLQYARA